MTFCEKHWYNIEAFEARQALLCEEKHCKPMVEQHLIFFCWKILFFCSYINRYMLTQDLLAWNFRKWNHSILYDCLFNTPVFSLLKDTFNWKYVQYICYLQQNGRGHKCFFFFSLVFLREMNLACTYKIVTVNSMLPWILSVPEIAVYFMTMKINEWVMLFNNETWVICLFSNGIFHSDALGKYD